jgi:hypothetical protein
MGRAGLMLMQMCANREQYEPKAMSIEGLVPYAKKRQAAHIRIDMPTPHLSLNSANHNSHAVVRFSRQ